MSAQVVVALGGLLISALTLAVLFRLIRSFGCYTERIERSNDGLRQSNEMTRQANDRAITEIGHARAESITIMNELKRFQDELSQYTSHRSA